MNPLEMDLGNGRNNPTKLDKFLIADGRSSLYQLTIGVQTDTILQHYVTLLLTICHDFIGQDEDLSPARVNSYLFSSIIT